MAHDATELRERAAQVPFPPYAVLPPHTHEWVAGRCACGFRLLRSGMMVKYPGPRNSCGCECHYATDGAERPLAEFRVTYLSRVTAQQSGYALRDLCRGCYREMRHADRVAHFVNWKARIVPGAARVPRLARVRPRDRCDETTRMRRARSGRHPQSQIARAIESPSGRGGTAPPSSDPDPCTRPHS